MRTKRGKEKPRFEWVIVENAHRAILSEEEAKALAETRAALAKNRKFITGYRMRANSPYLLSGGLLRCGRCGANMTGFRTSAPYYVCGSQPDRRGLGCGPGVYIRKEKVEAEAIAGLTELVDICADGGAFIREANDAICQHWQEYTGSGPDAARKIEVLDGKIANIHSAIEEGLADTAWASERLQALGAEREAMAASLAVADEPPVIDAKAADACRRDVKRTLRSGTIPERKRLLRHWIDGMKVAPKSRQVEITYRIPEPLVNGVVAGAGYILLHNGFSDYLTRIWQAPKNASRQSRPRRALK